MAKNLLIVDDSATTRAFIRKTVRMAGYDSEVVLEASDGAAALEILSTKSVDLVLADLHMPVMDGIEMVRRMHADEKLRNIPVVVVSADPNEQRIEQLKKSGIAACVRKPFTPEMIRSTLEHVWGSAHV